MPHNSTNLTRLARALAAADGLPYQEALRLVRRTAGHGLLPSPLNSANRSAALAAVRAANPASQPPQPWSASWPRTPLSQAQADEFFAGGGLEGNLVATSYGNVPGGPFHFYATCRRAGATDAQTREVYEVEASRPFATADRYAVCRQAGATHQEALSVCSRDLPAGSYVSARGVGATHQEATDPEIITLGSEYANLRRAGRSHAELVKLATSGTAVINQEEYDYLRRSGADHSEALGCLYCAPGATQVYVSALKAGATHPEALELGVAQYRLAPGTATMLEPYISQRTLGYSHQDAMIVAVNQIVYGTAPKQQSVQTELRTSPARAQIYRIAGDRLEALTGRLGRSPTLTEVREDLLECCLNWAKGHLTRTDATLSDAELLELCLIKLRKQGLLSAIDELDSAYGWTVDARGSLVDMTSFVRRHVIDNGPTMTEDLAALLSVDSVALYERLMREGRSARLRVQNGTWSIDERPDTNIPPDR